MANLPIALQLYTVREHTAEDFAGTVEKVAEMGYAGVELAGSGGLSADQVKALLDRCGLKPAGSHIGLDRLEKELDLVIAENLEIGNKWVVCPYLGEDRRKDGAAWRSIASLFNEIGAACKEKGLVFAYHNHAFEFEVFDGETGLDILYGSVNPDVVKGEVDVYWVKKGGRCPAEFIRKYAGRIPLVHLKDMADDEAGSFAEVGNGVIDFTGIFEAAEAGGSEWYIVEQDRCPGDSLVSAKQSFDNIKKMGKV
jgi:sugar phosphate isomerase/epimerase